ncbi:MAG: antitoxin VapB family protein [Candidatus Pacearchaeota archaeon]
MEKTTIAITHEAKDKMQEFGFKGESYSDLILRLVKSAKERQLHDLLMNEEDTISIEEALANAKKQWR